jgi:TusA-related sulfurtransferase
MAMATTLTLQANATVDTRGTSCQGLILGAKQAIVGAKVGEVVAVVTTDRGTKRDLPRWAAKMGHEFLGLVEERGYIKLFVRRLH